MDKTCSVCVKTVFDTQKGIKCMNQCERWFHHSCAGIATAEYKRLLSDTCNKWICGRNDCITKQQQPLLLLTTKITLLADSIAAMATQFGEIKTISGKLDEISNDLKSVKETLSTLEPRVSAIELRTEALEQIVLSHELTQPRVLAVEGKVRSLEQTMTSQHESISFETIFGEINDRARRARNVILYNINESTASEARARLDFDKNLVGKVVNALCPNIKIDDMKILRLGNRAEGRIRPLLLVFENEVQAKFLLKHFSSDIVKEIDSKFNKARISHDRTPRERNYLTQLRNELTTRSSKGEDALTIKFRNGIPEIVQEASKN